MRKPSYKTSEFWFTFVSFIMSGLFLFGVIQEPDTKNEITDIFTHVTEAKYDTKFDDISYYTLGNSTIVGAKCLLSA